VKRLGIAAAGALAWVVALGAFAPALAETQRELVAEAVSQAFTIRVSADYGGAAKLPFFFGSYADANLTNPPAGADGQASWYNLGIAETAVFTPPGECTPEAQQERIGQAMTDVTDWVTQTAIPRLLEQQEIAVLPIPTVPCSERLPGFSQSRYPSSGSIADSDSDDLLWSTVCAAGGCSLGDALQPVTDPAFDGGSFEATATGQPSQNSDAAMAGIHVSGLLDIASAHATATAELKDDKLITEATWAAADVCIVPGDDGCALSIRSIRQFARVERDAAGHVLARDRRTVIAGVEGGGQSEEITAADLGPGLPPIELGDNLFIRGVSSTGDCGDPAAPSVADAGGLEIFGQGSGAPTPTLPVPIVGSTTGGGVLLGGACAAGRLQAVSFDVPQAPGPGTIDIPGRTIVTPGLGGGPGGAGRSGPLLSDPRVVTKESVRYVLRNAPAWRTAPIWGSVLAALMLALMVGYFFRRSRPVAPVVAAIDRFARQFVRG
jgi:hypothetical protein